MANGACVVSTNVGGVPWMVTDRYDSMLVPPDDEVAMVDAIKELLWNQELAAQVSLNARRTAELHDWSMVLPEWEMVFRKVLTDGNESC
jgi:glycosyltransferase involved in cell wall biosynthesis